MRGEEYITIYEYQPYSCFEPCLWLRIRNILTMTRTIIQPPRPEDSDTSVK